MKLNFRNGMMRLGLAVMTAAALSVSAQAADAKIGIVDLKKVFEGYYKTRQADAQLKERAGDAEKVLKGMIDDFQKANEDYKKVIDSANDQAVSNDERERRKKSAENKLMELQEIERSVKKYRGDTQQALDDQKRRMRESILGQIREVVAAKAKVAGYTHVFDTAADSVNFTPVLLYTSGENDLTEAVLKEINVGAPAGLDLTSPPPAARGATNAPATNALPSVDLLNRK